MVQYIDLTRFRKCSIKVIDIKVDVKLTIMEPLYEKWLSEFYNYISSLDGQEITQNGWLRAGITDAIKMWSSKLTSLNPFLDICSNKDFVVNGYPSQAEFTCPELVNPLDHVPRMLIQSDCDSDWEEEETHDHGHLTFLKHPQHFTLLQIFDICFICFLSSYFYFLKSIPKLQFQAFCFTSPFLSPN